MSAEQPDLEEYLRSPHWPQPRPRPRESEARDPSYLRVILVGVVGVALMIPLFVMGWWLRPQLPPEGTRIFFGAGFQFQHPEEWRVIDQIRFGPATAPGLSLQAVGIDEINAVVVGRYSINAAVTDGNIEEVRSEVLNALSEVLISSGGWVVQSGPLDTTMASSPGYRFRVTSSIAGGTEVASRLTVVVAGSTMYVLSCQHTPERALEIETGCDQVEESFRIAD
jgi:hypothetical protein